MTRKEFEDIIWKEVSRCPDDWRKGQSVFNVIDKTFGVARAVQFKDGIDCFFNDNAIDEFIERAWARVKLIKEDGK